MNPCQNTALPTGTLLSGEQRTYHIESVLGKGGFGITYLATTRAVIDNLSYILPVAIKEHFLSDVCDRDPVTLAVTFPEASRGTVEASLKSFISEAGRLITFRDISPDIVKISEIIEANNTAYYVMEYLEGETLYDYVLREGPLSEARAWKLLLPIINAVRALHSNRLTHLDIKPDNIMLTRNPDKTISPVLIDFGLSKHYDNTGLPTSTVLTFAFSPGFAPVEQYAGISTFSPQSDIYALGATAMFCLTGTVPPPSPTLKQGDIARQLILRAPDIREASFNAITTSMQLYKVDRPEDVGMLADAARDILSASPAEPDNRLLPEAPDIIVPESDGPSADTEDAIILRPVYVPAGPAARPGDMNAVAAAPQLPHRIRNSSHKNFHLFVVIIIAAIAFAIGLIVENNREEADPGVLYEEPLPDWIIDSDTETYGESNYNGY